MESGSDRNTVLQNWLDRLKGGDEQARHELLKHAYSRLAVLARRKLKQFERRENTDFVLHEGLLRLEKALQQVRPDTVLQFFALASKHMRWVLLNLKERKPTVELRQDGAE